MPAPRSVQLEIDRFKKENPDLASGATDQAIFKYIKSDYPHLKWDEADRSTTKTHKRRDTSPHAMNAFSSMFDLWINEDSSDMMKSAYNNSLTGLTEELIKGEKRYDIKEGGPDGYDPNIFQDIVSMVASFLMPLDLLTFGAGGKFVGQPLAKMATAGMKSRAGSQFGKRALDAMIPAALAQAGTLATYEGAMGGVLSGLNNENVLAGIAKGIMHGSIMGGAAGLAGGGLSFKHAKVLKELGKKGKIAKPGEEAVAKLDIYDRSKMLATGLPGQIAAEAGVFTTGETLETAIDPSRDVRLEDIITSFGKNIGLFGILKGKSKLLERGKKHVKLLEELEILKNAKDSLNKKKTKESKVYHETYDEGVKEVAEMRERGDNIAADKYQKSLDEIKSKASKIDKKHFENRDAYQDLIKNLDFLIEAAKSGVEPKHNVDNFNRIISTLDGLIEAENKLGKSGAYKALTSQMERTKKDVNKILTKANEDAMDFIESQKKLVETPEEKLIRVQGEAEDRGLEFIKIGKDKIPVEEASAEQIEARLRPLREAEQKKIELVAAEAGIPTAKKIGKETARELGKLDPIDSFGEQGLSTKVEISELKVGSGAHAKKHKYVGKKAHDLINKSKLRSSTKKKIYLGVKEFFPQSGGRMSHLYEVIKYAEYLERNGIKFDDSTGSHFKKYLKTTKKWGQRNIIANRLQKFYGGVHGTAWGKIMHGQGFAGKYMRTGIGLANVGVLDVKWADVQLGKATRITSTQKGTMTEVIEYLPEKINVDKNAPEIPNIVKKPIAKNTVQALFETFYKIPKRMQEMVGLKVKDIDVKNGTVKFNITKGREKVETFDLKALDPALWDIIVSLRKGKSQGDYIFSDTNKKQFSNPTVNGILDFLVKESGVTPVSMRGGKKFTSHHFRHSAATDAETIYRESGGTKDYVDLVQQVLLSHEPDKLTRTHYIDKKVTNINKELAEFYAEREGIKESTTKDAKTALNRIKIAEKIKKITTAEDKKQVESIAAEIQTSAKELGEQKAHFKKKFPQLTIAIKKTLGKYNGEYILGRITGHAVEIAKGRAGADTMPHEVAHHVVDILRKFGDKRSKQIIKDGEKMFGGEEQLVQAIGEYGAGRLRNKSVISKAKSWVQEFWSNMRTKLGWYTEADVVRTLGRKLMTGKIPTGEIADFKAKHQTKGQALKDKKDLNKIIRSELNKMKIPTPILKEAKEAIFGTENLEKYTEWASLHQVREFNKFVQNPKNWHVSKVETINAEHHISPEISKQHLRDLGVKEGIPENATIETIKEYKSFIRENYDKPIPVDNSHDWILNLSDRKYKALKVLGRAITPVWLVLKNHGGKPGRKISEKLLNHEWAEHVIYKGPADQGLHIIRNTLGRKKTKFVHLFDIERTEARINRKKGDEYYTKEGELSAEERAFYRRMQQKGTEEYEAYNTWTNSKETGVADFMWETMFKELSEHHTPSEIAKLRKELDAKRVQGYMTRVWTKRALQTIKDDSPWMLKMVENNLENAARAEAKIWGENKSKEEISNKRKELVKSDAFKDQIRGELYDALRFGYAVVKNPHLIERGALMPEYVNVTNEKGRKETVKVYENSMENTAEAYVSRMSKFLSTIRYFPEWTGLGSKYKLGKNKRLQVEALEADDTVGAYAALAIKRQLGVDKSHLEALNRPLYKAGAIFTNASAAIGLSSPLSGIKNTLIGIPRSMGDFGIRNTARGIVRYFDSTAKAEARAKGQLEYGAKTLELGRVGWGRFKMSTLFKFNLMTQSENVNRIVSSHAGQLYFGETLAKLRGEGGMFKMGTNKGRMRRVMTELWHLTPEEIKLLETSKNLSAPEISQAYGEIMHKVGHFSHVSSQGGTSAVLLPLWMSSKEGRPLTLFQRMAMATTIDSYRNFVKPALNYGNFAPLIRATFGHAVSGGVLFWMYKNLLGKEPPTGSELAQDDTFDKVLMNLWRSEFLGVLGEVLSPYDRDQVVPIMEPVVIRNLTEAKENLHSLLSGGKTFKQAALDYSRNTVVVWGQAGEMYKRTLKDRYYGKFKSTRSWTTKFKKEKGIELYSSDSLVTRRQSSYRELRDAIFFGSDKDIAVTYWAAYNTVVTDLEKRNKKSSPSWRDKKAKEHIKAMIRLFDPLNVADTQQGTPHTLRNEFLSWLTPENKEIVLDTEKRYHYKIRNYNRIINNPRWRNKLSAYG